MDSAGSYPNTQESFAFDQSLNFFHGYAPAQQAHSHDLTPHRHSSITANPSLSQSPAPSSRLAGEPAFCAGRHCCHWQINGYACNNHYPSAEDLDRHIASDHAGRHPDGQPSGDYHCYWAGCSKTESFGNKPKLTRHIHSHTGHKPHQCQHPGCGKGFVTKEQLKNHETTHTRTREHVCPECGKGFAVKTALTSHMNVHKGAKPYVCDECGKGFADSSNLSKHKAIHKRAALKQAHTRRTSCASTLTSPSSISTPIMAAPQHFGAMPTQHLPPTFLAPSLDKDFCPTRPCFDMQCPDPHHLPCRSPSPCRSPPCTDPGCAAESCPVPVTCASPECAQEPCELPHCTVPDCNWADCNFDHCELPHCDFDGCDFVHCPELGGGGEHIDCLECGGSAEEESLPTPSTRQSFPATTSNDPHQLQQHQHALHGPAAAMIRDHSAHSHGEDGSCELPEGFKHLQAFIHSDFCGCVDGDDLQ